MTKLILSTATAVGLFLTPAIAEQSKMDAAMKDSTTTAGKTETDSADRTDGAAATRSATSVQDDTDASADVAANAADQKARDDATKSATQAGMANVAILDRAFVLEGTNKAGNQV